ncbi:hypothetical protein PVAP13_1KG254705 [Panicum virgatum]|uniref:Uncharacterized protein n=1 Tax=Panicum virgatum TaxID=38727 RepID=A0A8T0XLP4_PANVG|nr:hypothetical protein PVAP13_1KG254705 [Panicum virgatum]
MSSTQIHGHQSTGAMATVGSPSHGGRFLSSSSGSRCGSRGRGGRGGRAAGPRGRSGGGVDGPDGRAVAVDLTWAMGSPHGGSSAAVTRSEQMPPAAMAPSPRPQPCPTQVRREGIQWLQACCLRRREVGGRGRKNHGGARPRPLVRGAPPRMPTTQTRRRTTWQRQFYSGTHGSTAKAMLLSPSPL